MSMTSQECVSTHSYQSNLLLILGLISRRTNFKLYEFNPLFENIFEITIMDFSCNTSQNCSMNCSIVLNLDMMLQSWLVLDEEFIIVI